MISQSGIKQTLANALIALGDLAPVITVVSKNTAFDPLTSTTTETLTEAVGKGIVDKSKFRYTDDTTQANKHYVMYLQSDVEPLINDIIKVSTDEYNILFINAIKPNNVVLVYEVGLKL